MCVQEVPPPHTHSSSRAVRSIYSCSNARLQGGNSSMRLSNVEEGTLKTIALRGCALFAPQIPHRICCYGYVSLLSRSEAICRMEGTAFFSVSFLHLGRSESRCKHFGSSERFLLIVFWAFSAFIAFCDAPPRIR